MLALLVLSVLATNALKPQVVFTKVQKTGSTTLERLFETYRTQRGGPGRKSLDINGFELPLRSESPKHAALAASAKQQPEKYTFLWIVPLREPLERTVSHFYQDRPCKFGGAGSLVPSCKIRAEKGYTAWLTGCHHANNHLSRYFPNMTVLQYADQLILNDRVHESLLLLHLQFPMVFPVASLIPSTYRSHVHANTSWEDIKTQKKTLSRKSHPSCTDQWLAIEGISTLPATFKCTVGCAGRAGYMLRSNEEKKETARRNRKDIRLWQHALFIWNVQKNAILAKASMTELDFNTLVVRTFGQHQD